MELNRGFSDNETQMAVKYLRKVQHPYLLLSFNIKVALYFYYTLKHTHMWREKIEDGTVKKREKERETERETDRRERASHIYLLTNVNTFVLFISGYKKLEYLRILECKSYKK